MNQSLLHDSLRAAIDIATLAHHGQTDKAGVAYLLHPLAVMDAVRKALPDDRDAHAAAVLHDVLEDTVWSADMLVRHGVSERAVRLVQTLSRRPHESYAQFIGRVILAGEVPMRIKLADIEHNLSRMDALTKEKRGSLPARYEQARSAIQAALASLQPQSPDHERLRG